MVSSLPQDSACSRPLQYFIPLITVLTGATEAAPCMLVVHHVAVEDDNVSVCIAGPLLSVLAVWCADMLRASEAKGAARQAHA